ncbi:hypothetical protein SESBI_31681 [Sesbania bispinosa]|nr:hypothetical protein SESBI_31681 [Sesbania bispinosa]
MMTGTALAGAAVDTIWNSGAAKRRLAMADGGAPKTEIASAYMQQRPPVPDGAICCHRFERF